MVPMLVRRRRLCLNMSEDCRSVAGGQTSGCCRLLAGWGGNRADHVELSEARGFADENHGSIHRAGAGGPGESPGAPNHGPGSGKADSWPVRQWNGLKDESNPEFGAVGTHELVSRGAGAGEQVDQLVRGFRGRPAE